MFTKKTNEDEIIEEKGGDEIIEEKGEEQ